MIKWTDIFTKEEAQKALDKLYLRGKCETIEDEKLQRESSLNTPERK